MDEREIEAVAEVLAWEFGISERPSQRIIDASAKAVAALDRVRDARGDDEGEGPAMADISVEREQQIADGVALDDASSATEQSEPSPQGEDHEVGSFTIRWDDSMGCYRVSIPNYEGGEVVPIEVHRAALAPVSPSRVGSVAVEALEGIRFALESGPVAVPEIEEALDLVDRYLAEFSRSSTDRPEQPEPDVLGGQPPAEPETTGGTSDA